MSDKRAICLNCIDGRTQIPVINWITENYAIDYVDMITEPGMDGLLANLDTPIDDIKKKILISIERNNASILFIAGHHDCRGNAVTYDDHKTHIQQATNRLTTELPQIPIVGLWINSDWKVEKL